MEPIKIKLSYIVVALNKSSQNLGKSYINLLLTDKFEIPNVIIDRIGENDSHLSLLKTLHEEYVEYSFDFPYKHLCGVRFVNNLVEITYLITVNYVPRMNKKGRLFSFEEIQERGIVIEDYYGEFFARSGPNIFRQTTPNDYVAN